MVRIPEQPGADPASAVRTFVPIDSSNPVADVTRQIGRDLFNLGQRMVREEENQSVREADLLMTRAVNAGQLQAEQEPDPRLILPAFNDTLEKAYRDAEKLVHPRVRQAWTAEARQFIERASQPVRLMTFQRVRSLAKASGIQGIREEAMRLGNSPFPDKELPASLERFETMVSRLATGVFDPDEIEQIRQSWGARLEETTVKASFNKGLFKEGVSIARGAKYLLPDAREGLIASGVSELQDRNAKNVKLRVLELNQQIDSPEFSATFTPAKVAAFRRNVDGLLGHVKQLNQPGVLMIRDSQVTELVGNIMTLEEKADTFERVISIAMAARSGAHQLVPGTSKEEDAAADYLVRLEESLNEGAGLPYAVGMSGLVKDLGIIPRKIALDVSRLLRSGSAEAKIEAATILGPIIDENLDQPRFMKTGLLSELDIRYLHALWRANSGNRGEAPQEIVKAADLKMGVNLTQEEQAIRRRSIDQVAMLKREDVTRILSEKLDGIQTGYSGTSYKDLTVGKYVKILDDNPDLATESVVARFPAMVDEFQDRYLHHLSTGVDDETAQFSALQDTMSVWRPTALPGLGYAGFVRGESPEDLLGQVGGDPHWFVYELTDDLRQAFEAGDVEVETELGKVGTDALPFPDTGSLQRLGFTVGKVLETVKTVLTAGYSDPEGVVGAFTALANMPGTDERVPFRLVRSSSDVVRVVGKDEQGRNLVSFVPAFEIHVGVYPKNELTSEDAVEVDRESREPVFYRLWNKKTQAPLAVTFDADSSPARAAELARVSAHAERVRNADKSIAQAWGEALTSVDIGGTNALHAAARTAKLKVVDDWFGAAALAFENVQGRLVSDFEQGQRLAKSVFDSELENIRSLPGQDIDANELHTLIRGRKELP